MLKCKYDVYSTGRIVLCNMKDRGDVDILDRSYDGYHAK